MVKSLVCGIALTVFQYAHESGWLLGHKQIIAHMFVKQL